MHGSQVKQVNKIECKIFRLHKTITKEENITRKLAEEITIKKTEVHHMMQKTY